MALLIVLAAIGGYWYAHTQTQELKEEVSNTEKICEVDRAKWGADQRQITALNVSLDECGRKLNDTNNKLEEMKEKYYKTDLKKKENQIKLDGRKKEETKDLKAFKTCQKDLMECKTLVGGERNSKLRLEIENEELKKKIAEYQELIHTQSREQQQKNQHSHEQQKNQHSHEQQKDQHSHDEV